jgi:hypothetical protein
MHAKSVFISSGELVAGGGIPRAPCTVDSGRGKNLLTVAGPAVASHTFGMGYGGGSNLRLEPNGIDPGPENHHMKTTT